MSMTVRLDLIRAISQAYVNSIEPQTITIYGNDVAYCTWDIIEGETSRSAVFVNNGVSWYKATNGNKAMTTIAYYQLGCHGWDYETFNRKTGLCLDVPTRRVVEEEITKTRALADKRKSMLEEVL